MPNTTGPPRNEPVGNKRFADLRLGGKVFIVTGGARGLGLAIAEALVEASEKDNLVTRQPPPDAPLTLPGPVHCLDIQKEPDHMQEWTQAQRRVVPGARMGRIPQLRAAGPATPSISRTRWSKIAHDNQQLDGVVSAAGIVQTTPALDYKLADVTRILATNYTGVFMTAQAGARAMIKYKSREHAWWRACRASSQTRACSRPCTTRPMRADPVGAQPGHGIESPCATTAAEEYAPTASARDTSRRPWCGRC